MVIYFDDILIYFDKQKHHIQHVQKNLICLSQTALFSKPKNVNSTKKKLKSWNLLSTLKTFK